MTRLCFVLVFAPTLAYGQAAPAIGALLPKQPPMTVPSNAESAPGSTPPAFSADRPGLTDPSSLLSVGMLQIETGFELSGSNDGTTTSRQALLPLVLVRVGVFPRLELRVAADGYAQSIVNVNDTQTATAGFSDGSVSAKIKVLESESLNFTIIPILSVPSNDESFSSGTFDPTVEFVFDRGLPLDFEIGWNVNGAVLSSEEGRFVEASGGVAIARAIVGELGAYAEIFGSTPLGGIDLELIANGGLTYVFENLYQLDIAYGKSLTTPGDFFLGFGFSARIMRWY